MRSQLACALLLACTIVIPSSGQAISRDDLVFYTAEWSGERFEDGRPKIPDDLIERLRQVSIEEAWQVLRNHNYHNQFTGDWMLLNEDQVIAGRALTAQYMPLRPEVQKRMLDRGHTAGRIGAMNSWPIDMLTKGDVYVADAYGKVADGTLIGDNLGNSIFARSGNGVVFNGSVRDIEGLGEIEGFNAFVKGWHPSFIQEMMLMGVNTPIRIGEATVFPGDAVLAKREGVIFIPAHLVKEVVETAEIVGLRDSFGHQRLREGKYTPGQIDTRWTPEIEKDFYQWLEQNADRLPVPRTRIQEILQKRTW